MADKRKWQEYSIKALKPAPFHYFMGHLPFTTKRTIQAYTTGSDAYLKEWHHRPYRIPPHLEVWMSHLPPTSHVLDLGCGPGQDSRHLRRLEFRAVGLDLTLPFLKVARKRSPKLPLVLADLERLPFQSNSFQGIWAAASCIHLPKSKFKSTLRHFHVLTCPKGILGATLVHGKGSGFLEDKWIPGRYLCKWLKPELRKVIQQAGWEILSLQTVTHRERKGRWLNVIARREG